MFVRKTRRLSIAIAVAVIALLVPSVAGAPAASKKKHKADVSVRAARVDTQGDSNTVVGTLSGAPLGSGAVVYKTKPAGSQLAATYRAFTAKGSFRGTSLVTPTPQADGSTAFAGKLQVKGGTGRYRGAKGKDLDITGRFDPVTNVFTFSIKGSIRY
jgi:hypothetical protein